MGTTYRFIADPSESSEVLKWFARLPDPPVQVRTERSVVLYFKTYGRLVYDASGELDAKSSPVANVFLPRARRGILWTVGEIHFLTTPLRGKFPSLYGVSSRLNQWLKMHECVYSHDMQDSAYNYYFEGSTKSKIPPIFAFDSGLKALTSGRYFVSDDDNELVLDTLCRTLRLREVICSEG